MKTKTTSLIHTPMGFAAITVAALLFAGIVLVFSTAIAGTKFKIRGDVQEVDTKNKILTVYVTHIVKGGSAITYRGVPYSVRVSKKGAAVWKYNAAGKLVRMKMESALNKNVSIEGEVRDDDSLDASRVIIR